jgi:HlyD family secretion protein
MMSEIVTEERKNGVQNPPENMDRQLPKKKWTAQRLGLIAGGLLLVGSIAYLAFFADKRSRLNVEAEKISIATVQRGPFQEFIVQTGNVLPLQTVFIDAIEGGNIKRIVRESGAVVRQGDTLLLLTNSALQLEVMNREAQLFDQINNMRNSRLLLEQNDINRRSQLAEIDYQMQVLKPQFERFKTLVAAKAISQREFEEVKENFDYQRNRRKLMQNAYRADSLYRMRQLDQFGQSEDRMWRSLNAVGQILDNLVVRAPAAGQLSAPDLQPGQAVQRGQRLGQVDLMNNFKLRVRIDELYLPRIAVGQPGSCEFNNEEYRLSISKIFPTITDGRFEVDMEFVERMPQGIKRGQSMRARLELGNSAEALLLPVGGFYKDTGGNWVYVMEADGKRASKRAIKLGRKNTEHFEVLEGLKPGEKVITSSYEYFGDNEVLVIKE